MAAGGRKGSGSDGGGSGREEDGSEEGASEDVELKGLRNVCNDERNVVSNICKELSSNTSVHATLEKSADQSAQSVSDVSTNALHRMAELEKEIERLQREIIVINSDRTMMETYVNEEFSMRKSLSAGPVTAMQQQHTMLVYSQEQEIMGLTGEMASLQVDKRHLADRIKELEQVHHNEPSGTANDHEGKLKDVQQVESAAELTALLRQSETNLQQSRQENSELTKQIQSLRLEMPNLAKAAVDTQQAQKILADQEYLVHDNTMLQEYIEQLQLQLQTLSNQTSSTQQINNETQLDHERIEDEISRLQKENQSLVENRSKFMESFEKRLSDVEKEFSKMLNQAEEENSRLIQELKGTNVKLNEANSEINETIISFDYLQAEMQDLRDRNTWLEDAYTKLSQHLENPQLSNQHLEERMAAMELENRDLERTVTLLRTGSTSADTYQMKETPLNNILDHDQHYPYIARNWEVQNDELKARLERSQAQTRILQATVDQLLNAHESINYASTISENSHPSILTNLPSTQDGSTVTDQRSMHILAAITSPVRHRSDTGTMMVKPSVNEERHTNTYESHVPISPHHTRRRSRTYQSNTESSAWPSPKLSSSAGLLSASSPSKSIDNANMVGRTLDPRSIESRRHQSYTQLEDMTAPTVPISMMPRSRSRDSTIHSLAPMQDSTAIYSRASSTLPSKPPSVATTSTSKVVATDWQDYLRIAGELELELKQLTQRKEMLQAEYSRLPVHATPQTRRKKEEVDAMLDEVHKQCRYVRMRLKEMNFM